MKQRPSNPFHKALFTRSQIYKLRNQRNQQENYQLSFSKNQPTQEEIEMNQPKQAHNHQISILRKEGMHKIHIHSQTISLEIKIHKSKQTWSRNTFLRI